MTEKKKHFVQLFTMSGAQINVVTYMSFSEIAAELAEDNEAQNINLVGLDQNEEIVHIRFFRSDVRGHMYGTLPNQRIVTPVNIQAGLVQ